MLHILPNKIIKKIDQLFKYFLILIVNEYNAYML